ncbi:7fd28948-abe8-40f7-8a86-9b7a331bb273 [Thermothielavioides terrestris]|uniref:7fd28948-abe8-40f7-8a86-9b7a331bb273 n=1 Tax=Thermothielavioides terrestris TaxID=2587410 RepID=A0A3S4EVZ8_9PEZI|nr:7fd28948-abe8-40f7-8a86-9b7a331bb273 [Thermothielavioides terrestris]
MQRPPQPVFAGSPNTIQSGPTTHPSSDRRVLPDRNVNGSSIEDAYVAFILYCNPAVPLDVETAALREAFRAPPKSGGKSFSTFALFELIKKLETKELKTWAELALKLGVEPPDQEKGQSSQKIQQYAVRLKRWMHSMHIDAFFEYLIGRPTSYWTEIPSAHIPVAELERDGVAAEDDMALRALLPQIKPRRGRRKAEDDETGKSPPPRPSPQADGFGGGARQDAAEPWTAQPDGRGSVFLFPPVPDPSRLNPSGPSWSNNDIVQTPLTAYPVPQSAITPSTRNQFWADEPKSAVTPSKPRSASRRHGAKVVSSAWRSGGIGGGGKARGRPPVNRGANSEGPFSAFPSSEAPVFRFPSPIPEKETTPNNSAAAHTSNPNPTISTPARQGPVTHPGPSSQSQPAHNSSQQSPVQETAPPRPAKRSRLSLQVPERVGGEVRLATPPLPEPAAPPVVMVNGQTTDAQSAPTSKTPSDNGVNTISTQNPGSLVGASLPRGAAIGGTQQVFSQDPTDRTNMDGIEALFVSSILGAEWYDAKQNRIPACGVEEAWAFSQRVIENLLRSASTKGEFLINLAALAGGQLLMHKGSLRITRLEELADRTRYSCTWQLRFGDIVGDWAMEETVAHEKWKKPPDRDQDQRGSTGTAAAAASAAAAPNGASGSQEASDRAEHWERKYVELAAKLQEREQEMMRLKAKVIEAIRRC